jgi:glycosyltransferase involved in cell wall biosynthesis
MSKNKITRWIDAQNEAICLHFSGVYIRKKGTGIFAVLTFVLWNSPILILRSLILVAQFLRFNRALLDPYLTILSRNQAVGRKMSELLITLSGARLFTKPAYTAEYYADITLDFSLKSPSAPRVSIIIPMHNALTSTLHTLRALNHNLPNDIPVEIIIVDDASKGDYQEHISSIPGVTYLRNLNALGLYESGLQAARTARGKYISILTPGVIIQKGWLENALHVIENDTSVDVVGSKILYWNGILKEAGGVNLSSSKNALYGQYGHPAHHKYDFNRQVDFCSQTIFRKEVSGSLDIPKVIYVCTSEVVDLGAALTHNKNIQTPKTVERKARKFVPQRSILVIDVNLPFYDRDSGSNRMLHLLKIFKQLDYHILFLPDDGVASEPYFSLLRNLGVEVITPYMGKRVWKNEVSDCLRMVDICWLSRPELNRKYGYLLELNPTVKWVYDTVDLHYIRLMREADLVTDEPTRTRLNLQGKAFKALEIALSKKADVTIAITQEEAKNLSANGANLVKVVPNIHVPQQGTDQEFIKRHGIMFIGGFYHQPNVDAVIWLINEIMPAVWHALPEIKVYLVGSNPPEDVLKLANDQVIVTGYINDVSCYFNQSRIFVAPLRYGAGMKGKIGQALEYALPIVSTKIGTEGMNLENGTHVLEANTAAELQDSIIDLYTNKELWEKLHNNALSALRPLLFDFQKENVNEILSALSRPYKITIVSVVRNAEATLQNLIDSVSRYKTPEVEFLIWDGQSTDGTLRILEENRAIIDHYVSLPDSGIYDAINKATQLARGEFLLFMGADDELFAGFKHILPLLKDKRTIYYGGVYMENERVSKPYSAYQLTKQHLCHQAIIYPRAVFDKYTYDTRYNVFADYHLNLKCWTDPAFKQHHEDFIIAKFSSGGYSDVSQDLNYTRDKEDWFGRLLSPWDYIRYLKRKLGYAGVLSELLGGLKPYTLPKKESPRLSILFINKDFTGDYQAINPQRTFDLMCKLSSLNYDIIFLTPKPYFTNRQLDELKKIGVSVIDKGISLESITPLLDQVEFIWLLGQENDKEILKSIKRKRHIKTIFDTSAFPKGRWIKANVAIFHDQEPKVPALTTLFNNLR